MQMILCIHDLTATLSNSFTSGFFFFLVDAWGFLYIGSILNESRDGFMSSFVFWVFFFIFDLLALPMLCLVGRERVGIFALNLVIEERLQSFRSLWFG